MHGSFGRADTYNNMAAIGPDFKRSFVDRLPASNADVAITLAHILGFEIPHQGELKGRVLSEALLRRPQKVPFSSGSLEYFPIDANKLFVTSKTLESLPASNNVRTILKYQEVNGTRYFDTTRLSRSR
jgi:hypothetical protein